MGTIILSILFAISPGLALAADGDPKPEEENQEQQRLSDAEKEESERERKKEEETEELERIVEELLAERGDVDDATIQRVKKSPALQRLAASGLLDNAAASMVPEFNFSFQTEDGKVILVPGGGAGGDRLFLGPDKHSDYLFEVDAGPLGRMEPSGAAQALSSLFSEALEEGTAVARGSSADTADDDIDTIAADSNMRDAVGAYKNAEGAANALKAKLAGLYELNFPKIDPEQAVGRGEDPLSGGEGKKRWQDGGREAFFVQEEGGRSVAYVERNLNGQEVRMRFNADGIPSIYSVWKGEKWTRISALSSKERAAFKDALPGTMVRTQSGPDGEKRVFAYSFDEYGHGKRAFQRVRVNGQSLWLGLNNNEAYSAPEGSRIRRVQLGQGSSALVAFSPDGTATLTHAGKGTTLKTAEQSDFEGKKSFVDGQFAYQIAGGDGAVGIRLYAQRFDGEGGRGWIAAEGKPRQIPEGSTERLLRVDSRHSALMRVDANGDAQVTHILDRKSENTSLFRPAGEHGLDLKEITRVEMKAPSSDGKQDDVRLTFARGEDGFTGKISEQRLRGSARDTWIKVDGAVLDRERGSSLALHRARDGNKFLVQFRDNGAVAEVIRAGRGSVLGNDFSGLEGASFKITALFDGAGKAPSTGFEYAVRGEAPGEEGQAPGISVEKQRQFVDIGAGLGQWQPLSEGKPLTGALLLKRASELRAKEKERLRGVIANAESYGQSQQATASAGHYRYPGVTSRLQSVFQRGSPGAITVGEVRKAALGKGQTVALGEIGTAGASVYRTRLNGPSGPAARSLFISSDNEGVSAVVESRLGAHSETVQHLSKTPQTSSPLRTGLGGVDTLAQLGTQMINSLGEKTLLLSMLPLHATIASISGPQLQQNLDQRVNRNYAWLAAGVGAMRNQGLSSQGQNALNRGRLAGRIANRRIYSNAYGRYNEAVGGMRHGRHMSKEASVAGFRLQQLELIDATEKPLTQQGISSIDYVDARSGDTRLGMSYATADGGRFLLPLDFKDTALDGAELQTKGLPEGTGPARLLAAAWDIGLNRTLINAQNKAKKEGTTFAGLDQKTIARVLDTVTQRHFAVDAAGASQIRERILGQEGSPSARPKGLVHAGDPGLGSLIGRSGGYQMLGYTSRGRESHLILDSRGPREVVAGRVGEEITERNGRYYYGDIQVVHDHDFTKDKTPVWFSLKGKAQIERERAATQNAAATAQKPASAPPAKPETTEPAQASAIPFDPSAAVQGRASGIPVRDGHLSVGERDSRGRQFSGYNRHGYAIYYYPRRSGVPYSFFSEAEVENRNGRLYAGDRRVYHGGEYDANRRPIYVAYD